MKEVETKRYAGPFNTIPYNNYIQSPIGLVPKDGGKKTRFIFHLLFPKNSSISVNANTPEELKSVNYKDFDKAVKICVSLGIFDVYLCKSDLAHAFRNLPINSSFWRYLIMKAQDPVTSQIFYFVDKCLPFGAAISCAVFQAFSDALAHIVRVKTGFNNINYLDDFLFIAMIRTMCQNQLDIFLETCGTINFPVSMDKTVAPTKLLEFLGLLIDTKKGIICIPQEKLDRARNMVKHLIGKRKATKREMQQLTGFLNFLGKCIVPGRAFTRRLYSHGKDLDKPHLHFNISQELKLDLRLWECILDNPECYYRKMFHFDEKLVYSPLEFFTDASTSKGCGGICYNQWFILEWNEDFMKINKPSINYLELYALMLGILAWGNRFRDRCIVIFCVIHMVNNTTSSNKNCMVLIRMLVLHSTEYNIRIKVKYVRSEQNNFADLLSRLEYKRFRELARQRKKRFEGKPIEIPDQLWPMDKVWIPELDD